MYDHTDAQVAAPANVTAFRGDFPRRLYKIPEVAAMLGMSAATLGFHVDHHRLPVVHLPSSGEAPRRQRRVPAGWADHWPDMMDRGHPLLTDHDEFMAAATGPLYIPVRRAAEALGASDKWLYEVILSGGFPQPAVVGKTYRVKRVVLDEWVWQLIHQAETEWYELGNVRRLEAVAGGRR